MIYFGDIHNHNQLGYGKGSLERSIAIARSHLDFFAFTGHSSWHDMPVMEGGREQNWIDGFAKLEQGWGEVQRLTAEADQGQDFVAFLGFEWHSSAFGDQCVIFPDDYRERVAPDDIEGLRSFCRRRNALMIPHHLSYPTGHRGVNWEVFTEECTPVVEIFSEHGCSEHDRAPYPYFNHSMGPRISTNTVQAGLQSGHRFGFTASSDSHRGFPGGWDEGVTAVHADALTRSAILLAVRQRRTYALTGDRIRIDFQADGEPMGSTLDDVKRVQTKFQVEARDAVDVVEMIQDGRVVDRFYPESPRRVDGTIQIRIEWGWGPWLDMDLDRIADWDFDVELRGARIRESFPCFRSGPFDEDRRHFVRQDSDELVNVRSYSGRRGAYRGNPNHSLVLELDATPSAELEISLISPGKKSASFRLSDLHDGGRAVFTGPYPAECMLIHRPVTFAESHVFGETILETGRERSYAYLRVRQKNGQMAWTSPVFLNYG